MRRKLIVIGLLLCFALPLQAQDEIPTPYDIALQRIEEARVSGATELDLSALGLTELPPEIGQLTELQRLDLRYNQLGHLPPEIGQLNSLRGLSLANNQLSSLPPEIGQLSNLHRLDLRNNVLRGLPPEIGQLTNLSWLDLNDNALTSVPPEIGNLTNLQLLYLHNNALNSLPSEMRYLTQIAASECNFCELSLVGNPVVYPPPEIVVQGTTAILDFLQAEYERQQAEKMRLMVLTSLGGWLVIFLIMGFAYKQHGGRKSKKKRENSSE